MYVQNMVDAGLYIPKPGFLPVFNFCPPCLLVVNQSPFHYSGLNGQSLGTPFYHPTSGRSGKNLFFIVLRSLWTAAFWPASMIID